MTRFQFTNFTADEIVKAMGPYSYGKGTERTLPRLVNTLAHGLLEINAGYRTGGTLTSVLRGMGLITVQRGGLTAKGRMFLYDCYNGAMAIYEAAP